MHGLAGDPVVSMIETFTDNPGQVPVSDAVNDVPAILTGVHQPGEAQLGKMLAHRGARRPRPFHEGTDIARTMGEQPQDVQPGRICEHAEQGCGNLKPFLVGVPRMVEARAPVFRVFGHPVPPVPWPVASAAARSRSTRGAKQPTGQV